MRRLVLLVALLALVAAPAAHAEDVTVIGVDGAPGGASAGGSGGDAVAEASGTENASATAAGGRGGVGSPGGDGGDAASSASAAHAGPEAVTVGASATGGEGGRGDVGPGGAAGSAHASASGASSGGGRVAVTAIQTGGRGGGALASDGAQRGADSFMANAVEGTTTGPLALTQRAIGGSGGRADFFVFNDPRAQGGAGGDAASALSLATDAASLEVTSEARAGRAGAGGLLAPGRAGGEADATAALHNGDGAIAARTLAWAGSGGGGQAGGAGGDASAQIEASTSGAGHALRVGIDPATLPPATNPDDLFQSGARGGDGGAGTGMASGDGGRAASGSRGTAQGDAAVAVFDQARGGAGGAVAGNGTAGTGGAATSLAEARGGGLASVSAASQAIGGRGGRSNLVLPGQPNALVLGRGGAASAAALAAGLGEAEAAADAIGGSGGFETAGGSALASATAAGASGAASASATLVRRGAVAAEPRASAPVQGAASAGAQAWFAGFGAPVGTDGLDAFALAEVWTADRPGSGAEAGGFAGTLVSATLGALDRQPAADAIVLRTSVWIFSEAIGLPGAFAPLPTDRLVLDLLDPVATGAGFDLLSFYVQISDSSGNATLIERSFTDAGEALAFFAGSLDLGSYEALRTGRLLVGLDVALGGVGDGFRSDFALVLVPEPGTAMLVGIGLLALGLRRRAP